MGLVYTACFENVAVSVTQDLFELTPSDPFNPCMLHSLFLYNVGADVGDAAEEMLRITIKTLGTPTAGSGGAAAIANGVESSSGLTPDAAVVANNTTKATAATVTRLKGVGGWNIRGPFERVWTPETRPWVGHDNDDDVATILVVRLEASPADAISMSGEITFEEFLN